MNPLSGSEWSDMGPGGAPSPRLNFATVYDSAADRVILFGGYDGTNDGSDQTWAYDFESNAWSNLAPIVHPNAGWTQRAAYDRAAGRTIMFGGFDGVLGAFTDKTWALDAGNNTWTDLAPSSHPSVRSRQGMTYDAQSDRVILFGGLASDGYSAETWAYDSGANAWTALAPSIHPDARRSMGLVYDSAADRVILFGGTDASLTGLSDTWAYDLEANAWTNLVPAVSPSARYGFGFVYDSGIDRCLLFGGMTESGSSSETWAYDLTTNTWALLSPDSSPAARWIPGMEYDRGSGRTILVGGQGDPDVLNDTWSLTTQTAPPLAPQGLTAPAGSGRVDLVWHAPLSDGLSPITGYSVYRGPNAQEVTILAQLGGVLSYTDTGVSNGVPYFYRVSAINAMGEGPLSAPADATPDGQPPVTTATLFGTPGRDGWFISGAVTVTLQATDDHSGVADTSVRMDGGSWRTYTESFSVTSDGIHSVDFFSRDAVGNTEPTQTVRAAIDTVPPSSQAILSGTAVDAYWFRSEVSVSFATSDATSGVASVRYRLDGADWQPYSTPFSVGDGHHVLESSATDVAGLAEDAHAVTFGVDTSAPSAGVSLYGARGANGWYVGPVLVSIEASDAMTGATISYRLDGGDWIEYRGSFVVSGDGGHTVEYNAVDGVGNSFAGSASVSIDGTAPHSVLSADGIVGRDGWFVSEVGLTIESVDAASGVAQIQVRIDGGAPTRYTSAILLGDGIHTIVYAATDAAGNLEPLHSAIVSVDSTAPRSTISLFGTPGDHGWYRSTVVAALRSEDVTSGIASLGYRLDGGGWVSYAGAIAMSSGSHTIQFAASDVAGLTEPVQSVVVRIDADPPILEHLVPSGHLTSTHVTVRWSGADVGSGIDHYQISIDGSGWMDLGSKSDTALLLSDGRHTITVRAVDVAGNTAKSTVDVIVDTGVFSLGGPYGGLPTFGVLAAVVLLLTAIGVWRRRRRT